MFCFSFRWVLAAVLGLEEKGGFFFSFFFFESLYSHGVQGHGEEGEFVVWGGAKPASIFLFLFLFLFLGVVRD